MATAKATAAARKAAAADNEPDEDFIVPTPGEWIQTAPGHYTWEPGTAQALHPEHEPIVIHPTSTGYTSEHGQWWFSGRPDLPEGGVEGRHDTVTDIDRQIAELQARKAKLQDDQAK